MKKIFILTAALFSMTIASQASNMLLNCTQVAITATALNSANLSCAGFGVLQASLGTINSITFYQSTDYNVTIDPTAPGLISNTAINYTMTVPGTVFDALVTNRNFTRGVTGNPLVQVSVVPPAVYGDYVNAFLIGATLNSVTNTTGAVISQVTFDGTFVVDYTLPQSGVPEPTTIALIGAGLVGLAASARRRR